MKLLLDSRDMRPFCAIVQACYHEHSNRILSLFDSQTWITVPNDHMVMADFEEDQWKAVAEIVNKQTKDRVEV